MCELLGVVVYTCDLNTWDILRLDNCGFKIAAWATTGLWGEFTMVGL